MTLEKIRVRRRRFRRDWSGGWPAPHEAGEGGPPKSRRKLDVGVAGVSRILERDESVYREDSEIKQRIFLQ